ncbi:MAG: stress response serine/threonine protein kinase YihE [Polaromonas sp. 39-63-203]|jgi:Ser/Thr protein kinase RdoA (MazF antagonist)|uniref:serine/threonine protein kinase n=1 Tax=Polaromonas sp. TaxID=1869339 RepID=UPI000BD4C2D2|nr:serine/threonine protein kinase [Polaromonas sp.]OYY53741.1 MAG: stress response serine/threonine protein kinase YihE [Polaromonas sp. 35-63-240]OYZ01520.1 MAG: stress response serine/threonine protein kinase YihE [Polaromonas sp. 28-63-22]OYZ84726.1 MAG: stress response serine/threonine protein kinase YihE [Polaromonas sp. 24-62-144]OZB00509.1 MAG: stress response serine/threonine protein kinase YihE [Polaromonas sp. 39-63-203]HQS32704.1 serine/threonine protein kinase [Polaromonas sp.]
MTEKSETAAPAARHAYEPLTPDVVLDALASVGLLGDGRILALSSYENRVYQIHLESPVGAGDLAGDVVVAKFYRPERWSDAQIVEEHAFAAELMTAEIPVVGPLTLNGHTLNHFGGFSFSVSPSRGGRRPELDNLDVLAWIGRFLARIHTVGSSAPFLQRPALNLQTFGYASRDVLLAGGYLPLDMASRWHKAFDEAMLTALAVFESVGEVRQLRLHGDCHPGNILWTPEGLPGAGPHFVDLDDARTGPAVQDLWMLTSGDRAQCTRQLGALVDGYEEFRAFDRRELALIEPLRTLRLVHYSAWLAQRWHDPIFPINFPWFGSSDYWKGQVDMLEEQNEAMQAAPLVV